MTDIRDLMNPLAARNHTALGYAAVYGFIGGVQNSYDGITCGMTAEEREAYLKSKEPINLQDLEECIPDMSLIKYEGKCTPRIDKRGSYASTNPIISSITHIMKDENKKQMQQEIDEYYKLIKEQNNIIRNLARLKKQSQAIELKLQAQLNLIRMM